MLKIERPPSPNVVVWTIDQPRSKNALDRATLEALLDAVRDAASDRDLRAAVLTGEGHVFVSGGDLRELRDRHSREDGEWLSDAGYDLTTAIAELPFPVIAALPGPAIGGGAELAIACDMRVADARASISFKQARMGVTTAWGTIPRLVALAGPSAAARLLFTAREVGAAECKLLRLVDEVTGDGLAKPTALAWAADVALASPKAIAAMKRLLRETTKTSHDVRSLEREAFIETWSGPDHREAVDAWFERRAPTWTARS